MTDRLEAFHAFLAAEPAPALEAVTRRLYEGLTGEETGDEEECLKEKIELVRQTRGLQSAVNVLSRLEVALGFRKPSLGLYDNALHFIGGAQKYGCTLAHTLQDDFEVTLIANSEVTREQLESWYGLDLARCRIKVVQIPYFEEREKQRGVFDAGLVELRKDNPFHAISLESGKYDVFVNNCMLEMVYPLAPISEMVRRGSRNAGGSSRTSTSIPLSTWFLLYRNAWRKNGTSSCLWLDSSRAATNSSWR
jgi:hypothetical protein